MYVSHPDPRKNTAKQRTILVVDDDPAIHFMLKTTLTRAGYHVHSAVTGTEGLVAARHEKPDMILLDVVLPDGSGMDFCRDFRNLPGFHSVSLMLMSSQAVSPSEQAQGLEAGADDYMAKPLAINELLARIRNLFRLRQAEESLLENERLLRMTQRLAKVGGWEWSVERETLTWTEETFRIHGFSTSEVLTSRQRVEKCLQCYRPEDHEMLRGALVRCVEQGDPFELELPFTSADGSRLWVRVTAEAVLDQGRVVRVIGFIMDITRLKNDQEQIKTISEEYERVFQSTQDCMFLIRVDDGPEFRFIRNNHSHQQQTGLALRDLQGKTPRELLGPELGDMVAANYVRCILAGSSISYEEQLPLPGGERIWHTTLTPVLEGDTIVYIVGSSQDISQRKKAEEKLRILATTDELTSLWNRRYFLEALQREIKRVKRYGQPLSLLMMDIDHFKCINDEHGHDVGDQVLRGFAKSLREHFRENDIPGRLGGEEFAVLLPATGMEGALAVAERFREYVEDCPMCSLNPAIQITISIGIAEYAPDLAKVDDLLIRADRALYQAKNKGRNRTDVDGRQCLTTVPNVENAR